MENSKIGTHIGGNKKGKGAHTMGTKLSHERFLTKSKSEKMSSEKGTLRGEKSHPNDKNCFPKCKPRNTLAHETGGVRNTKHHGAKDIDSYKGHK